MVAGVEVGVEVVGIPEADAVVFLFPTFFPASIDVASIRRKSGSVGR